MASFGELLGQDIHEARESRGWTQLALAEHTFADPNYERRIRDDETGKVKRPQAKAYQPLCDALAITRQRIGELKAAASNARDVNSDEMQELHLEKSSLEKALSDLQTLNRGQLETIATRFEVDSAFDLSDPALIDLLSNKAQDYRVLRDEVAAINPETQTPLQPKSRRLRRD